MRTKQVKATIPEETHRMMRVALARTGTSFNSWLNACIFNFLDASGKLTKAEAKTLREGYRTIQHKGKEG